MKIELTKNDDGYKLRIHEGYRDISVCLKGDRTNSREAFDRLLAWFEAYASVDNEVLPEADLPMKATVS